MAKTLASPPQVGAQVLAQELDLAQLTPLADVLLLVSEQPRVVCVTVANADHRADGYRRGTGWDRPADQEPVVTVAPQPHPQYRRDARALR